MTKAIIVRQDGQYVITAEGAGLISAIAGQAMSAADRAEGAAEAAFESANYAEEFSGPAYDTVGDGEAATAVGHFFRVPIPGTDPVEYTRYQRTAGGSVEAAPLATTAALSSPNGAGMVGLGDGAMAQDAIAVAANPVALIASTKPLVAGSTVRTADGHLYKVADAGASDHHITTAGGVKLYVADPAITPDALGCPRDGVNDDAPYFESAFRLSKVVSLVPTSTYRLASIIGLPDQTLYSVVSLFLYCNGAKIVANSPLVSGVPEAIFTSAAAKANPDSTSDLYTGKVFIGGGNWTEDGTSVLFNGDRIYDLTLVGNSFADLDTVVKSYRSKGVNYPNGYIQSLSMTGNQFSGIRRWVDAKRAFDVSFDGNGGTNCSGGIYIDGPDDAAVTSIRYIDNRFQGGGCALVLGKVIGGVILGYYGEGNTLGDAATAKCDIWFKAGAAPSSGVTLIGCKFQPTSGQNADTAYCSIRWDNTSNQPAGAAAPPVLIGCWSTGTRIITPNTCVDFIGVGGGAQNTIRNTRAPMSPQSARRTTLSVTRTYLASAEMSGGVYNIAKISIADIKALTASYQQRPAQGEIRVLMQHRTAGGVVVGSSVAVIGFVAMASSEGVSPANAVDDVYCGFWLSGFAMVPSGLNLDTLGAVTRTHFTAPALTATRAGDNYILALSGYAAVSNPNYGAADRINSHITIQADGRNNSGAFSSAIAVAT